MRKLFILALFLGSISFVSCKKEYDKKVTLVRDCSGTYLRLNEKDYHVCNPEKVAAYKDNETLVATFTKLKECRGSANDAIVCMMYHENEGWIQVEYIK